MGRIKVLFMDVDGTLTDGKIYMGNTGEIMKAFYVKDGYAINEILPSAGIIPVIITGRDSKILYNRCREIGIVNIFQGISDKKKKMADLIRDLSLKISDEGIILGAAYIGDDLPDLDVIDMCEISGCPFDAVEAVKSKCDFVSTKKGGEGAVREFIEYIVRLE